MRLKQNKHTPTPWKNISGDWDGNIIIQTTHNEYAQATDEEVDFIVKAANNYYDLVEALKEAQKIIKELCRAYKNPEPLASMERFKTALEKAGIK